MRGGDDRSSFSCLHVSWYAGYVIHVGTLKSGALKKGDTVKIKVDYGRRAMIAKNHTNSPTKIA